jgi:hypothetical protein
MVYLDGALHWYSATALLEGALHWYSSMVLFGRTFDGALHWLSSIVLPDEAFHSSSIALFDGRSSMKISTALSSMAPVDDPLQRGHSTIGAV